MKTVRCPKCGNRFQVRLRLTEDAIRQELEEAVQTAIEHITALMRRDEAKLAEYQWVEKELQRLLED